MVADSRNVLTCRLVETSNLSPCRADRRSRLRRGKDYDQPNNQLAR